jgi:hypothetical protein
VCSTALSTKPNRYGHDDTDYNGVALCHTAWLAALLLSLLLGDQTAEGPAVNSPRGRYRQRSSSVEAQSIRMEEQQRILIEASKLRFGLS